ncbi:hypothetical protein A2572_00520 [Candidatus Collierbacteria bacterium RIFOXYD1_FULL_40_9]|uniref:Uncharacterized protein n=1 Tax=Candidatus Collierbacteria bacterium RIFOXYD1_FULL_40_9 TaxID=1817731 RepID=A0A1F5FWL3_9BACT|nr:MAG: hypothetical protein A2572_00520 [Candidatus Collierbacteria bacterium RIFOXYD1_FULL_40_9]
MELTQSISNLKGVGESTKEKLAKLGIYQILDLLRLLPNRYLDYSQKVKINKIVDEKKTVSFLAKIQNLKYFYTKTGKLFTQGLAKDDTGEIKLIWFNNPYIKKLIKEDTAYTIAGKTSKFANKVCLISPTVEEGDSLTLNTTGLVPVYPQTQGINSRWLRQKINHILSNTDISDPLEPIVDYAQALSVHQAYHQIHFPSTKDQKKQADKRLSFNEHLKISLKNLLELQNLGKSIKIQTNTILFESGLAKFPFQLTTDQIKVTNSLLSDLSKDHYTHRLIQGDTGSGKTATIILAANQSLNAGFSCVLLAPTQILANQHLASFKKYSLFPDNVSLVTTTNKLNFESSKPKVFIGTHSLINSLNSNLAFPLSFIAIDEQHKFGVEQRESLQKRNPIPHIFNLSATPIPRTVAQGLLGEIKISTIKYKPENRLPIKTHVINETYFNQKGLSWLNQKIFEGNKVFIVSPTIHTNETTTSTESLYLRYKKIFPTDLPIYVIHGKLKQEEQNKILSSFANTSKAILISTSLIEVGIDVPSASIMIIHSAERFGLAQLHQLRGRVGRGTNQSFCFLIPTSDDQEETERLKLMTIYNSGLTLAKKDLILRGSGEIFGQKQHGALQTKLKYFWSKKSYLLAKSYAKKLIAKNKTNAKNIATKLNYC